MLSAVQTDLFATTSLDSPPILYWPNFFSKSVADNLLTLSLGLDWCQNKMSMLGKEIPLPRLEAMFGDSTDFSYQYSGQVSLVANPWPHWLETVKNEIQIKTDYAFQLVIGNRYRTGSDSIGYHADDEHSLGLNPAIASLSLGSKRTFLIKRNARGSKSTKLELTHGSLLLMLPGCQESWVHSVPKTKKPTSTRVNWTFRPYKNSPKEGTSG